MVAQQTSNLKVEGSIPSSGVIFIFMKGQTDRSADLRLLHSSRASTDSNAFLSVYIDSITFEKPTSIIPGTKTRLEITLGKNVGKLNVEAKGSIMSLVIEKSVQFEYKLETDLSFSLYKKSPLINISTGVGPVY